MFFPGLLIGILIGLCLSSVLRIIQERLWP